MKRGVIYSATLGITAVVAVTLMWRNRPDPRARVQVLTAELSQLMRAAESGDHRAAADRIRGLSAEVESLKEDLISAGEEAVTGRIRTALARGPTERFRLLSPFLLSRSDDFSTAAAGLSPDEARAFYAAMDEVRSLARRKSDFESALSENEYRQVTSGLDSSFGDFRRNFPPHLKPAPCSVEDVNIIGSRLGWRHLTEIYFSVVMLNEFADVPFVPVLFPRLAEIARQRQDPAMRELAEIYADGDLVSLLFVENLQKHLTEARATLERVGYDGRGRQELRRLFLEAAPRCLVGLEPEVLTYISDETVKAELNALVILLNSRPESLQEIRRGAKAEAVLTTLLAESSGTGKNKWQAVDSWGTAYEFREEDSGWMLISAGPDTVFDTVDDISRRSGYP